MQQFDVVLCDYSLEEQHTGFEVISAARRLDPEVPAALLTGYATKETADEAASRGIGVMFKPIEIEEFLATTSNMLRRNNESKQEGGKKTTAVRKTTTKAEPATAVLDLVPPPASPKVESPKRATAGRPLRLWRD